MHHKVGGQAEEYRFIDFTLFITRLTPSHYFDFHVESRFLALRLLLFDQIQVPGNTAIKIVKLSSLERLCSRITLRTSEWQQYKVILVFLWTRSDPDKIITLQALRLKPKAHVIGQGILSTSPLGGYGGMRRSGKMSHYYAAHRGQHALE